jgi:hypothetical protein
MRILVLMRSYADGGRGQARFSTESAVQGLEIEIAVRVNQEIKRRNCVFPENHLSVCLAPSTGGKKRFTQTK